MMRLLFVILSVVLVTGCKDEEVQTVSASPGGAKPPAPPTASSPAKPAIQVPPMPSDLKHDPTKALSRACHLENLRRAAASKSKDNPLQAEEAQKKFKMFESNIGMANQWLSFIDAEFLSLKEADGGFEVTIKHARVQTVRDNNIVWVEEEDCGDGKTTLSCVFPSEDKAGLAKLGKGSKFVFAAYYGPDHPNYLRPIACRFLREGSE